MEEEIRKAIQKALEKEGIRGVSFSIERPPELNHGDYATNAALKAFGPMEHGNSKDVSRGSRSHTTYRYQGPVFSGKFKDPRELADSLAARLAETLGEHATRVTVAGPGFVNITLSRKAIALAVAEAVAQGEEWGKGEEHKGRRVMVEYANPNPFKEMHIGHLMSAIIGEAVARLTASRGAQVVRSSFGGDVGPHVAKALWGLQQAAVHSITSAQEIGAAYARASAAYDSDESVRAEIDALNVRLYAVVARAGDAALSGGDHELLSLWKSGREISMEEFRRLFSILGTRLDYDFFDSDTTETGLRVVNDGLARGVFEKSDGAVIYRGEKKGVHTLVFITSRGTPTYEAKDIGLAFLKEERFSGDESIVLTSTEQIGHFKTVLAALSEVAPPLARKTTHVAHGLLRLATGKMSSREGNVITAAGFIDDIITKAMEKNEDPLIAEQVAVGAIKYMVLRQAPGSDIVFDPEKSLSLEGDSGPYLQYALVRARKILTYVGNGEPGSEEPVAPYAIERMILHYPEAASRAAREKAPNVLTTYLTELAGEWNSFYASEQVLGSPEEAYKQRAARAFANTMTNGLTLLGIPTPERM
jgi:arginyl-tRNA synthetase